jgi:hypothetical protein
MGYVNGMYMEFHGLYGSVEIGWAVAGRPAKSAAAKAKPRTAPAPAGLGRRMVIVRLLA